MKCVIFLKVLPVVDSEGGLRVFFDLSFTSEDSAMTLYEVTTYPVNDPYRGNLVLHNLVTYEKLNSKQV